MTLVEWLTQMASVEKDPISLFAFDMVPANHLRPAYREAWLRATAWDAPRWVKIPDEIEITEEVWNEYFLKKETENLCPTCQKPVQKTAYFASFENFDMPSYKKVHFCAENHRWNVDWPDGAMFQSAKSDHYRVALRTFHSWDDPYIFDEHFPSLQTAEKFAIQEIKNHKDFSSLNSKVLEVLDSVGNVLLRFHGEGTLMKFFLELSPKRHKVELPKEV
jgi:hypothetical protein